jgi:hypothetical protein
MSANEVQDILGPPKDRQFNGDNEAWQYCSTGIGIPDEFTLIWMYRETVTGMERYRNTESGSCESFFRQVKFEDVPDIIIENRRR